MDVSEKKIKSRKLFRIASKTLSILKEGLFTFLKSLSQKHIGQGLWPACQVMSEETIKRNDDVDVRVCIW